MLKIKDNVYGIITSTIADTDANPLSINLTSGHGARFDALSSGDFFLAALVNEPPNKVEVVLCYARSSDTLTCLRARNGTSAQDWSSGDRIIQISDTMSVWAEHQDLFKLKNSPTLSGTNTLTVSYSSQYQGLVDKMEFHAIAAGANTGAVTLAVTFDHSAFGGTTYAQSAKEVVDVSGAALAAGAIPAAGYSCRFRYSQSLDKFILVNPAYASRGYRMHRGATDDSLQISGGSSISDGARILLYGQSHADNPSDIQTYSRVLQAFIGTGGNFTVVKDADDSIILRVTEAGLATGAAIATRAQVHADEARLLSPAMARHVLGAARHFFVIKREVGGSFTTAFHEGGHGGFTSVATAGGDVINLTFNNAFSNSSYSAVVLTSGGKLLYTGGSAGLSRPSASVLRVDNVTTNWPEGTTIFGIAFGNKAVD